MLEYASYMPETAVRNMHLSPELQSDILMLIERILMEHDQYVLEPALDEIWKKLLVKNAKR